ncbi:hypothetical protein [Sporosarcina sp. Te-1]|uniref:hypothetical protein n=1 Tax=Sporosarcina sp. Te-1 TaxID=2818390 RepID=UPI001A9D6867|nr:hypothetical protein [Sporosarcina sp. Te-1]QTD41201.1 hypothetical protein J3U78_21170 [Sporosarcina sp. Te-1]
MIVTNYYLIGNFTLSSSWIAIIVAFAVAYSLVRMLFNAQSANRFADQFFIVLIIWKLSVVVTDAPLILQAPMSVIYFNGGLFGFCLGIIYVFVKLWMNIRRGNVTKEQLDSMMYGVILMQAFYQVGMASLNDGPLYARLATIVIFLALLLLTVWRIRKKTAVSNQEPLLFAAAHLFAASFQPAGYWNGALLITLLIVGFWMLVDYLTEKGIRRK